MNFLSMLNYDMIIKQRRCKRKMFIFLKRQTVVRE